MTTQKKKLKKKIGKPVEYIVSFLIDDQKPEQTIKIGSKLPPELQDEFIKFLREYKDVFAWSHEDMLGINPSIMVHCLNVDPLYTPVT